MGAVGNETVVLEGTNELVGDVCGGLPRVDPDRLFEPAKDDDRAGGMTSRLGAVEADIGPLITKANVRHAFELDKAADEEGENKYASALAEPVEGAAEVSGFHAGH